MKISNLKCRIARKIAVLVIAAGGILSTSLLACAQQTHIVGDPGYEQDAAAFSGFSYIDDLPTSPWESPPNHSWVYDTTYDTTIRPTPVGEIAAHGYGSYHGQTLSETFEAGRTYTLSVLAQADSDEVSDNDRVWLYFYDGTTDTGPQNGGGYLDYSLGGFSSLDGDFEVYDPGGAGSVWTEISFDYTAGAAEDGHQIGIAFFGRGNAAMDDVTLTSVPEPSMVVLAGLGIGFGGLLLVRHRRE
jgi:hypothetical protein